jgi:hypothetical protein
MSGESPMTLAGIQHRFGSCNCGSKGQEDLLIALVWLWCGLRVALGWL